MAPYLHGLHIYPLKSGRGLALPAAAVEPCGLQYDRRWMVVDEDGRFLTARRLPRMVLIEARPLPDGVILDAPGMPTCHVAEPGPQALRQSVKVWSSVCSAACADGAAENWLCQFLGVPVRLVYMDANCIRGTEAEYSRDGDTVSFADGFPLLLISEAALQQLNGRLVTPVTMARFRPNLVIGDCAPHAEDDWRQIRIGAVSFDVVKPCTRCVLTTVDPERGERDPSGEPLATLKTYRSDGHEVRFGMNLIPRGLGTLKVGDTLRVVR